MMEHKIYWHTLQGFSLFSFISWMPVRTSLSNPVEFASGVPCYSQAKRFWVSVRNKSSPIDRALLDRCLDLGVRLNLGWMLCLPGGSLPLGFGGPQIGVLTFTLWEFNPFNAQPRTAKMCRVPVRHVQEASCNWASQKNLAGSLLFKGHTDNVGDLGMCTECLFNKNLFGLLNISPFVVPFSKGSASSMQWYCPQSSKALVISWESREWWNRYAWTIEAVLIEEPCQYNAVLVNANKIRRVKSPYRHRSCNFATKYWPFLASTRAFYWTNFTAGWPVNPYHHQLAMVLSINHRWFTFVDQIVNRWLMVTWRISLMLITMDSPLLIIDHKSPWCFVDLAECRWTMAGDENLGHQLGCDPHGFSALESPRSYSVPRCTGQLLSSVCSTLALLKWICSQTFFVSSKYFI